MNINQKVRDGYNLAAKNYSFEFRDKFKNEKHLNKLLDVLPGGSLVLDVGCGAGRPIDIYLSSHGMRVTGIDISEAQIELARANVPQATFSVKDMSDLIDGEFTVDALVSFYAIFHTPREKHLELLKKFKTFLRPGGFILVTMGSSDWEGSENNFCGTKMYWSHFGAEKNIEIVREAGFEIVFSEIDDTGGEKHLVILARS